jgi:hypothetical protein
MATLAAHTRASIAAIAVVGRDAPKRPKSGAPRSLRQRTDIMYGMLSRKPHRVRRIALITPPTPAGTKIAAKMTPVATMRHLTQEERARPRMERNVIQIIAPLRRPTAMRRFAAIHGSDEE